MKSSTPGDFTRPPAAPNSRALSRQSQSSTAGSSSTPFPYTISSTSARMHGIQPRPVTSSSRVSSLRTPQSTLFVGSSSYPSHRLQGASTASGRKSRATSSIRGSEQHEIVCVVIESRGVSPVIGLAFINLTTNEAVLSQICDSQFYVKTIHKIQMYEPSVIVTVETAANPKSKFLSIMEEELRGIPIELLNRKYWSESHGLEFIQLLAFKEDLEAIKVAIHGNFYAACSFSAAVQFVESFYDMTILPHSLRLRYQPSEDTMTIDLATIHSLELIENLQNSKSKDCLFGLLNDTLTPMGSRILRSNILQPSTQLENTLTPRFDALDELTVKEDMFFEVRKAMKGVTDVERLLTSLVIVSNKPSILITEQSINKVLSIKAFVTIIPSIFEALGAARTELLSKIRSLLRPELLRQLVDLITETINEDVSVAKTSLDMQNQRTYAVKSGVHGLLDVARQTYKEATDDVHDHVDDINSEHQLSARIMFDTKRKYWLRLRQSDIEDRQLPEILINRVKKGIWLECQTLLLVQLNTRIVDSTNEAVMLSDKVIQELLNEIRAHVPHLFRVCESIGLLDMLSSFASIATVRDYVRPEMGDTLALKAARHPICEISEPESFVPNDVFANTEHRFQIIRGSNMSGKSTYIRTISLLQVMVQIGSFVPAQYAAFPLIHQLFIRVSTDDSIEANMSTFSLEMQEMAFILRNVDGKSLAIIDELGRGTSTRDGLAIAIAISEALLQSGAIVWFVTHFNQLAQVLGSRPGVQNLCFQTELIEEENQTPKMKMLYKVKSGILEEEHYGLNLARAIGLPEQVIETADRISQALIQDIERKKQDSQSVKLLKRRKLVLSLHGTLTELRNSQMDDEALGSYLRRLQDEFVLKMDEIGAEK